MFYNDSQGFHLVSPTVRIPMESDMKTLLRVVVVLVILVLVGIGGLLFAIDGLVGSALQKGIAFATESETEVEKTDLDVFGGGLRIQGLGIQNLAGFSDSDALHFDSLSTDVDLGSLTGDKVVVEHVTLDGLIVHMEQKDGKINLLELKKKLDRFATPSDGDEPSDPEPSPEGGKQFVIKKITISNAKAKLDALNLGPVDLPATTIDLPEIVLTDVGEGGEGEQLPAIVSEVLVAVIQQTLAGVKDIAGGAVDFATDLADQGVEQAKQAADQAAQAATDAVDQATQGASDALGGITGGANDAVQDASDKFKQGLGGLLSGSKDEEKKE